MTSAVFCLALAIYHEARGEPAVGQAMVAYVVLNRATWKPTKVCDTVFARKQFSFANGKVRKTKWGWALHESLRPKNAKAWGFSQVLARAALHLPPAKTERNISKGAKFYHAKRVRPDWAKSMQKVAHVGNHVFYRSES